MPNREEFKSLLKRMFIARIPFISIHSIERTRVLEVIGELANEVGGGIPIYVHSLSHGTKDIRTNKYVNEDRSFSGGLDFAVHNITQRSNLTFVFTEASDIEDDNSVSRHVYDCSIQAIDKGGCICLITTKPIWPQLQRMGMTLSLDPPNEEEMFEIVKDCVTAHRGQINIEWDDSEISAASAILANMTKIEAENVIATLMAKGELKKEDIKELSNIKDKLFSDISGLEKVKIDENTLAVAGLGGLQEWLNREKHLMTANLKDRLLRPPRGVLLVGVPGCGKSLSAKFIAANWNLPLFRLDLASIHGQYLGQSENRLKEALQSADNSAPCILWIDEIEKGLSGATSSSDGGTSLRMVGQFLFWLQESTAKVFVIATANDVSRLPPELLRRGRFDELFFVDLPSEEERSDIIKLYINRNKLNNPQEETFKYLIDISEGFSGADIESAVREVAKIAIRNSEEIINDDTYKKCFENVVPLSKTSPEQIDFIRQWGKERAVQASGKEIPTNGEFTTKRKILV